MPQEPSIRRSTVTAKTGPVSPDSPLHRLLKMIASAIVDRLETKAPPHTRQRTCR